MNSLQGRKWEEISTKTWGEIEGYQWENFRTVLYETETVKTSQGVSLKYSKGTGETKTVQTSQGVRVEFSSTILSTNTEMITNIVVSKKDYMSILLDYLPQFERESSAFKSLIESYSKEFIKLEQERDVVERNVFLDTAIESLEIEERDLGITYSNKLDYRQRREQISSRNRAIFEQTQDETIKNVARAFSNGDVELNPTDIPGIYEVKFVGTKGIPDNIGGLKESLNIIKPSHIMLTYKFTFNAWESLQNKRWIDCKDKTWDEIRTWEEVK